MQLLNDHCGHNSVCLNVCAQNEGMLAGPFETHGLVETLGGIIVLPYAQPDFAQALVSGTFEGSIDQQGAQSAVLEIR